MSDPRFRIPTKMSTAANGDQKKVFFALFLVCSHYNSVVSSHISVTIQIFKIAAVMHLTPSHLVFSYMLPRSLIIPSDFLRVGIAKPGS